MSWPIGVLSELADVTSGFAFKSTWFGDGTSKVIRIGDLQNGHVDIDKAVTFDSSAHLVKDSFKVKTGDILMALSGATVGKIAVVDDSSDGAYLNQRVAVIRAKNPESACYIKYVFNGSFLDKLLLEAGGAAQPNLSPKDLSNMEIPLPPLAEQKRIAAILDKADAIRQKRQQAIKLADEFLRSVFLEMFGDPNDAPITNVEQLAKLEKGSMRTGPFGSQLLHSEFTSEGIAVLGIDNAVKNHFEWAKERFISHEKYEELQKYTVYPGDVLITIMGTCGRCAVVPDNVPTAINTKHLCCITLDKTKCLPEFLHAYFLYHPMARRYLEKNTKGAIMAGLNMGIIKGMPIPQFPIHLQEKYKQLTVKQNIINQKFIGSDELTNDNFSSLSQKAFSGRL